MKFKVVNGALVAVLGPAGCVMLVDNILRDARALTQQSS